MNDFIKTYPREKSGIKFVIQIGPTPGYIGGVVVKVLVNHRKGQKAKVLWNCNELFKVCGIKKVSTNYCSCKGSYFSECTLTFRTNGCYSDIVDNIYKAIDDILVFPYQDVQTSWLGETDCSNQKYYERELIISIYKHLN